jgi:hypothetical protein
VQLPVGGSPVAIAHPIAGGYRRGRYVDYSILLLLLQDM